MQNENHNQVVQKIDRIDSMIYFQNYRDSLTYEFYKTAPCFNKDDFYIDKYGVLKSNYKNGVKFIQ
jgi:hypothetical protein